MSKDMSQEEANLAVATALMREALALREENNRLTKAIRLEAAANALLIQDNKRLRAELGAKG
jgi:hypothetical protein